MQLKINPQAQSDARLHPVQRHIPQSEILNLYMRGGFLFLGREPVHKFEQQNVEVQILRDIALRNGLFQNTSEKGVT